jgi:hypothetical protein
MENLADAVQSECVECPVNNRPCSICVKPSQASYVRLERNSWSADEQVLWGIVDGPNDVVDNSGGHTGHVLAHISATPCVSETTSVWKVLTSSNACT